MTASIWEDDSKVDCASSTSTTANDQKSILIFESGGVVYALVLSSIYDKAKTLGKTCADEGWPTTLARDDWKTTFIEDNKKGTYTISGNTVTIVEQGGNTSTLTYSSSGLTVNSGIARAAGVGTIFTKLD